MIRLAVDCETGSESIDLVSQKLDIASGCDRDELESIAQVVEHFERLCADRTCRADQRDAGARLLVYSARLDHSRKRSKAIAKNQPATKVKSSASIRSSMPP